MLGAYSYNNNAYTTLKGAISDSDATAVLDQATAPMNDPPVTTTNDPPARFTLMDDPANPTKIEIVEATVVSAPSSSEVTLSNLTRGLEGTTAQSWGGGSYVMQNVTKAMLNPPAVANVGPYSHPDPIFGGMAVSGGFDYAMSFAGNTMLRGDTANGGYLYVSAEAMEVGSATFSQATIDTFFSLSITCTGNAEVQGAFKAVGRIQMQGSPPANSTATGLAGQIAVDANYIYVCTASNTWKRVALSAF